MKFENKRSVAGVALVLLNTVALSGCRQYEGRTIQGTKLSVCTKFVKQGAAQEGTGTLRVLAYDSFGTYVDNQSEISYYPDKRSCVLMGVTVNPKEGSQELSPKGSDSLYRVYSSQGIAAATIDNKAELKISVDELVLSVDGKKIGGTIVAVEDRGDIIRVDADFDFSNPNALPGDIIAKYRKGALKKLKNESMDYMRKLLPKGVLTQELPTEQPASPTDLGSSGESTI